MRVVKVRIKRHLPQFVGDDLKYYGPYEPGDVADVTPVIAEILIMRDLAERVEDGGAGGRGSCRD